MDDDPGDAWFTARDRQWVAHREEGLRRFPSGSRVVDRGTGARGTVLAVDHQGDLHVDWEGTGAGIAVPSTWDGLDVVAGPG